jgi:uncharacterized protein (DUF1778 family)
MTTASTTKTPRDALDLRISSAERNLIDCAAESAVKTRTDFILETALRAPEGTLLCRALMVVGPEACSEFLKRLDCPAQRGERLRRTMRSRVLWRAA